jgi:hypothetical protein
MTEADLLRFTTNILNHSGLLWWRVSNGASLYSKGKKTFFRKSPIAGFPDVAGLTPDGQFWALELKTAKGRISPTQKNWIEKIKQSNGIAEIARSPTEVLKFIYSVSGKIKAPAQ